MAVPVPHGLMVNFVPFHRPRHEKNIRGRIYSSDTISDVINAIIAFTDFFDDHLSFITITLIKNCLALYNQTYILIIYYIIYYILYILNI